MLSVLPWTREGVTRASPSTSLIVRLTMLYDRLPRDETGDGSESFLPRGAIFTRGSAIRCVTRSMTLCMESPCRMRKLITAVARIGSTLSWGCR